MEKIVLTMLAFEKEKVFKVKKSDKNVLSSIFKFLEMHIEMVRGQTETLIKTSKCKLLPSLHAA